MSAVLCYGEDNQSICYWQRRFWQAFKMLTLEQREDMVKKIEMEEYE
jgi:uncharacterized protein YhfF